MSKIEQKIPSDVAFEDVKKFVEKHNAREFKRGNITDESIKNDYIDIIEAVEEGNLTFDDDLIATYKLIVPLYKEADNPALIKDTVKFRTRIKQFDKVKMMDGIDPEKEKGKFMLRLVALGSGLSLTDLKKLEDQDYITINQICSVF